MTDAFPPSDKTQLRARMRQVRSACAAAAPDAAERAADLAPLDILPAAAVVSGYWPGGSEISPLPLMRRLARAGAVLALPAARDRRSALTFRRWREGDALAPDAFAIPSPVPDAEEVEPDLVIAPLLAFDRSGARLGQGAGHYDRTLEGLRARKGVFVLGLAFAGQEIEAAPREPHDQPLDGVLTERGYLAMTPGVSA